MKRKRQKRSTILRIKIITYTVAVLMMLVYTSNGMAANDAYAKLFAGVWQVFIIMGLILYLRWQKLGALVVMGTALLQGLATLWLLSHYNLTAISTITGALSYIAPMLLVGSMLWLLKAPSPPSDAQNIMRDFTRLIDRHDTSYGDDESHDKEEKQIHRMKVEMRPV